MYFAPNKHVTATATRIHTMITSNRIGLEDWNKNYEVSLTENRDTGFGVVKNQMIPFCLMFGEKVEEWEYYVRCVWE